MVHLHLMASHLPVIGILLLIPLLLIALVRRSDELSKLGLWAAAGIALTGNPAQLHFAARVDVRTWLPGLV